jgi:hypothetical protein
MGLTAGNPFARAKGQAGANGFDAGQTRQDKNRPKPPQQSSKA